MSLFAHYWFLTTTASSYTGSNRLILKMMALQHLETSKLHVQRHTVTSLQDQNLQQRRSEDPKSHIQ